MLIHLVVNGNSAVHLLSNRDLRRVLVFDFIYVHSILHCFLLLLCLYSNSLLHSWNLIITIIALYFSTTYRGFTLNSKPNQVLGLPKWARPNPDLVVFYAGGRHWSCAAQIVQVKVLKTTR